MQTREPKRYISKIATSSGIVMSSEILTDCLSNMGRNNNIRAVSKLNSLILSYKTKNFIINKDI